MVNPVSDGSNQLIVPISDSLKHRDPSWKKGGLSQINVSLSEEAQELKMFASDSPLIGVLKKEFNEVFEFDSSKKDLFLKKLDHILLDNRL